MDITLAYFFPLLHPDVVKRDFEQIREAGAKSIVYAIHEQETQRFERDLERGLRLAQDMGLKVYLSLARHGNIFAGPTLMPSWYTFHHPRSCVLDQHGRYHDITCFNHQSFRAWLFREIEFYLTRLPINGILVDEPRGSDISCYCSVCRALCPDVADLQRFRRRSMIDFLGELCSHVKRVDPHAKTTVALLPHDFDQLDELAALPHLDTLAGHLFWQLLHVDAPTVGNWGRRITAAARLNGKRSQLWLQNFELDEQAEHQLEAVFAQVLDVDPTEIAAYYFWRNNTHPERVWQLTRDLLRRIPRRQLHWHTNKTPQPGELEVR